jgi:hypothetical protein
MLSEYKRGAVAMFIYALVILVYASPPTPLPQPPVSLLTASTPLLTFSAVTETEAAKNCADAATLIGKNLTANHILTQPYCVEINSPK